MKRETLLFVPILLTLFLIGCGSDGPETASVTGIITIDGEPAPKIEVMFIPEAGGRPATAISNDQGKYKLEYTASKSGALLGKHMVSFQPYAEDDFEMAELMKSFPQKYQQSGVLTANVESGSNKIDFDLKNE